MFNVYLKVFLLENPDVIMILLIHIRYFWVTRAPGKGKKKTRTNALYDFDHECAFWHIYCYTMNL